MIEVSPRLFVGNQIDYERNVKDKPGWLIVQACKEPYHRQALGYKGAAGPRDHAEYLFAYRDNRLILNMVDAPKPEFFRDEMIDAALKFISDGLADPDAKVLVHCNQGHSRSPSLALLHLRQTDSDWADCSFEEAEDNFRGIYQSYQPAAGIRGYVEKRWSPAPASA